MSSGCRLEHASQEASIGQRLNLLKLRVLRGMSPKYRWLCWPPSHRQADDRCRLALAGVIGASQRVGSIPVALWPRELPRRVHSSGPTQAPAGLRLCSPRLEPRAALAIRMARAGNTPAIL